MGVPTIKTGPMTVEEFYAFTDTRPDEEKWELIDGEPVLNASPSPLHQWIVGNLIVALGGRARGSHAEWAVLPGLGVRVSDINRPEPDVLIVSRASRWPIRPDAIEATSSSPSRSCLHRLRTAICAGSVRLIPACLLSLITW